MTDPALRHRQARWAGWASLVANTGIVVTGGAVRLTGSGLGGPTWPRCTEDDFTPHGALDFHSAIEFGNRLLTFVLVAVAVLLFVAALRTRRRDLVRLSVVLGLGIPVRNYAHRFVPVAEANLLLVTEVVLAPLWLWFWPGERPGATTLVGGGIALAAVTWLTVVTARAGEMERAPRRVGLHVGAAPGYRRFVRRTNGDR